MDELALPVLIWKERSPAKEEPVIRNIDSSCFASCFAIRSSIRLRILGLGRSMPWLETRPSCRTNENTLCVRMDANAAFGLARPAVVITRATGRKHTPGSIQWMSAASSRERFCVFWAFAL